MEGRELRKKLDLVNNLPTLPGVVQKIRTMVDSPTISAVDVGRVISSDQVLSARVLKLINSAFYGFPGRISSVSHGIVLLGFNVVKGLVLTASVFDMMAERMVGLWEHSLGTAITSLILARRVNHPEPEELFVAGLLHDIGKVVINVMIEDEAAEINKLVEEGELTKFEAEKAILGVTHATVGGWLCEKWNLPWSLTEPLSLHHAPHLARRAPERASIVHLADLLVRASGFGFAGDLFVPQLDKRAWEILQLDLAAIDEVIEEMEAEFLSAEKFQPT